MLDFNQHFRPTASELLKDKIFDKIRKPELEKLKPDQKFKIKVDYNEYRYDYENSKNISGDEKTLLKIQKLIIEESKKFAK